MLCCPPDNRSTLGYTHPNKPTPLEGHFLTEGIIRISPAAFCAEFYHKNELLAPALFALKKSCLDEDAVGGLTLFF